MSEDGVGHDHVSGAELMMTGSGISDAVSVMTISLTEKVIRGGGHDGLLHEPRRGMVP